MQGVIKCYDPSTGDGSVVMRYRPRRVRSRRRRARGLDLPHVAPGPASRLQPRRCRSGHKATPRLRSGHEDAGRLRRLPFRYASRRNGATVRKESIPMSASHHQRSAESLGGRVGWHPAARRRLLVRRLGGGVRAALQELVDCRHVHRLDEAKRPEQLLGTQRSGRRCPSRRPHVHLFRRSERTPAPTTTGASRRPMRAEMKGLYSRRDAGPHVVRRAVQHGPARLADRPHRRAADRQRRMSPSACGS